MNVWHSIDSRRITKEKFFACIEISSGSRNKYELDKETGLLKLDRILYTSTHYPANYGFIPKTYAQDKDPLDVLVLCNEEIIPLTLVESYPIGILKMIDDNEEDEKILAICKNDPYLNCYKDIYELPEQIMNEIWGMDSSTDENTIKVHINRIRNRFPDYPFEIKTVRGLGYKAVKKDEW